MVTMAQQDIVCQADAPTETTASAAPLDEETIIRDQYYRRTDIPERRLCIITATWSVLNHQRGTYSEALPLADDGTIDHERLFADEGLDRDTGRYFERHATVDRAALDLLHEDAVARAQRGEIGLRTPQQQRGSSADNEADAVAA